MGKLTDNLMMDTVTGKVCKQVVFRSWHGVRVAAGMPKKIRTVIWKVFFSLCKKVNKKCSERLLTGVAKAIRMRKIYRTLRLN